MTAGLCSAIEALPALKDKVAVSLASRLSVTRDHIKVMQARENFVDELADFFTGKGRRRQNQVNQNITAMLEQTIDELSSVMDSVSLSHRAIAAVSAEVQNLQNHTEVLAQELIGLDDRVDKLASSVDLRFQELQQQLHNVDARTRAEAHLVRVLECWRAGYLDELPLAARCYVSIEQLWWGDFGYFIANFPGADSAQLIRDLIMRLAGELARPVGADPFRRVAREYWVIQPGASSSSSSQAGLRQALLLFSDWSYPASTPFVSSIAGLVDAPEFECPLGFPHLMSAERIANALIREIFDVREALCA